MRGRERRSKSSTFGFLYANDTTISGSFYKKMLPVAVVYDMEIRWQVLKQFWKKGTLEQLFHSSDYTSRVNLSATLNKTVIKRSVFHSLTQQLTQCVTNRRGKVSFIDEPITTNLVTDKRW